MTKELIPIYDTRKSFYHKAITETKTNKEILYSYQLEVCTIEKNKPILKNVNRYSQTTLRHIKEFLKQNGFIALTKNQILKDYITQ